MGNSGNSQRYSYLLAGVHAETITETLCECFRVGMSETAACARAGVNQQTWIRWKKKARQAREDGVEDEYTALMDRVDVALADHQRSMLDVVHEVATEEEGKAADKLKAATWALEHRHAKDFGPRKAVELSGPVGGPVQVQALPPLVTAEAMAAGSLEQLRGLLGQVVELLESAGEDVLDEDDAEDEDSAE